MTAASAKIARAWLGTPYKHQTSCRGSGCDCLGLILGIWREMGGTAPLLPPYSNDWSEPQGEEQLWNVASTVLLRRDGAIRSGDILLFRMRKGAVAKHLGVISSPEEPARFIHAMCGRGVVQSQLTRPWANRVVARFAFPDPQQKGN